MLRLAAALATVAVAATDTLNIFQAFDKERYLAEATAAMRQAFSDGSPWLD